MLSSQGESVTLEVDRTVNAKFRGTREGKDQGFRKKARFGFVKDTREAHHIGAESGRKP